LDPGNFAARSLRSGFLTSGAASGASISKLPEVSRHKSVETLRAYVKQADLFQHHVGSFEHAPDRRVCMTAAMLVLDPIFEADLPSELYAYRAGRSAQQAVIEVEELMFHGHPEVVDAPVEVGSSNNFSGNSNFSIVAETSQKPAEIRCGNFT
jgi:predicted ATPase